MIYLCCFYIEIDLFTLWFQQWRTWGGRGRWRSDAVRWGRGSRALRQPDAAMEAAGQPHPQLLRPGVVEASRRPHPQAFQRGAMEAVGPRPPAHRRGAVQAAGRPRLVPRRPAHVRPTGRRPQNRPQGVYCILFFIKYICWWECDEICEACAQNLLIIICTCSYLSIWNYWLFICTLQLSKCHVLIHTYICDIYAYLIWQLVHFFFFYLILHATST